jgi:TrmH family RNA methyltransferase
MKLGPLERVRFVLCRPRNPLNIGAAARALQCAGVAEWFIVDPWTLDWDSARIVAVHSEAMLDKVKVVKTLAEAVEGCVLTIGTTGMERPERTALTPRETAAKVVETLGPVAVVFGDERSGLRATEMEVLDLLATIPGSPEQPSWNLAQSIAIFAYELRVAALQGLPASEAPEGKKADPGQVAAVDRALASALDDMGWLKVRRRLSRTLQRSGLTRREAALWVATILAVKKALGLESAAE